MDALAGVLAAFAILGLGTLTRQADALPFYSTVLIVIALVYWWPVVCAVVDGVLGGWLGYRSLVDRLNTSPSAA